MENTLRVTKLKHLSKMNSLNPCSNGKYSQRKDTLHNLYNEYCLNPCSNGKYSQRIK